MAKLSLLLLERSINFDPEDSHIMCLPHIINICSKHTTDDFSSADFTLVPEALFAISGSKINKCAYVAVLRKDPAARACDVVRAVCSSSLRRETFKELILDGNNKKWWRDEEQNVVELPVLELLRDTKTRWDSRYYMVNRLRLYRQVRCDDNTCVMSHSPTGY